MGQLSSEVLKMVRLFGLLEKDQICAGNVTVSQCFVLQELLSGQQKVTDLAKFAGVSPSAMTRLLDGLARKEWIQRIQPEGDRRKVLISLTSEGQALAEHLRGLTEESVAQVLAFVPDDKRDSVIESIGLLSQAVEQALERGLSCCGP